MPIFTHKKLKSMSYSVSAMMYYVGLKGQVNLDHHNVFFSKDYKAYLGKLMTHDSNINDMSFYVHNPSKIDATLAKPGHSALYILVPVPNLDANINWDTETMPLFDQVLRTMLEKTGIDIAPLIDTVNPLTPTMWANDYNVYKGAVFNLSHGFNQMLHKRPQNKVKGLKGMYLVGGGTHPGSGLPTIYQSAIITASYITKANKNTRD
jgi:phytoene desaturase